MNSLDRLQGLLLSLNAIWVLWLLVVLLVASLAVMVERALFFFGLRENVRELSKRLDQFLRRGDYEGALEALRASRSPAAAVVVEGLEHADLGPAAAEQAMVGAVALERARLERGLAFLGTLGNNAPFVGLLGTVLGVIKAFQSLGNEGPVSQAAGEVASRAVMKGVAEALIATAVGLLVAIPAVAAYNYFQRRIQASLALTEALRSILLAHLHANPRLLVMDEEVPLRSAQVVS